MSAQIYWFEGPDMSGKSTQVNALTEKLRKAGYKVAVLRNPGGDGVCGKIRSLLLDVNDGDFEEIDYMARRALNAADHLQKLKTINRIKNEYDFILCDRCTSISDMVYGFMTENDNFKREIKREAYKNLFNLDFLNSSLLDLDLNHNLVLFQVSEAEMIKRFQSTDRSDKPTIYDNADMDFKLQIRDNYDKIIHNYLRMERDEDSLTIDMMLKKFSFVTVIFSNDGAEDITNHISSIALAVQKVKEENNV